MLPTVNTAIDMPKISVIIPVFNAEKTIEKCVNSVLNQDFWDFELLLIDDGSADNGFSLCEKFSVEDSRVISIKQENSGAASTRNFGMSKAKGKYFCFVDSDDFLENGALSFMYDLAKKENADILMCGYNMVNGDAKMPIFAQSGVYIGAEINERICEIKAKNLIDSPCNKLYRAEFIRKSGVKMPENEIFEDTDFNLNLLKYNPKFVISDRCFYNYVLHMGSTTRKYSPEKLEIIKKRARLLKDVTEGVDGYCAFYFIKSVFSSFIDMFLSLDKKEIKKEIKTQISLDEFKANAKMADFAGLGSKILIFAAKSGSPFLCYAFAFSSYILKYKLQKLFLRVR